MWTAFLVGDIAVIGVVTAATAEWSGVGSEIVGTGVIFLMFLPLLVVVARYGGTAVVDTPQRRTGRRTLYFLTVLFVVLALWQAALSGTLNAGLIVSSILLFAVARLNVPKNRSDPAPP